MFCKDSHSTNKDRNLNETKNEYFSEIPVLFSAQETTNLSHIDNLFYANSTNEHDDEENEADNENTDDGGEYDSEDEIKGLSPKSQQDNQIDERVKIKKIQRKIYKIFTNDNKKHQGTKHVKRTNSFMDNELISYEIEYGNITNKYDPNSSLTSINTELQLNEAESMYNTNFHHLFPLLRSPINEIEQFLFSKNTIISSELNLIRKSSLICLIERNRSNNISCPFDEIVYKRFFLDNYEKHRLKLNNDTLYKDNDFFSKNECFFIENIKSFKLNVFDLDKIKLIDLMPNSVAMLLMQFFFDIFQPSELRNFFKTTLNIILELKNAFKPKLYFDEIVATSYLTENILWNCFALFNFRFEKTYLNGILNYFTSLYCVADYLEKKNELNKAKEIKKIAPFIAQALVLNGLFDRYDLWLLNNYYFKMVDTNLSPNTSYLNACLNRSSLSCNLKRIENNLDNQPCTSRSQANKRFKYVEESIMVLAREVDGDRPMMLKHMCRIKVKNYLREFNHKTVESLNVKDDLKSILFFNHEFELIYNETRSSLFKS